MVMAGFTLKFQVNGDSVEDIEQKILVITGEFFKGRTCWWEAKVTPCRTEWREATTNGEPPRLLDPLGGDDPIDIELPTNWSARVTAHG